MQDYPEALGQRPLEIDEAYQALETYARTYGRDPLLLMMHAAVPETFRADLLNLIKQNFLANYGTDLSVEADVLFSPLVTDLGGGYYRIDPQVRWHCLGLLHSRYRNEARTRQRRVAELLWRYVESMEQKSARIANPFFTEFLDIQRWVAFAFLAPAKAATAFAEALRTAGENPEAAALLRLGGLASAIELPLTHEPDLLNYARGLDALITGNNEQAQKILNNLGNEAITIGGVSLRAPTELLSQYGLLTETKMNGGEKISESPTLKTCFVVMGFGKKIDFETGRTLDLNMSYQNMIKPAVEAAGLQCFRADDVVGYSGMIDVPMYEQLLSADVVIVDYSASNKNAFYELGVRHALRPYTTIVIAEDGNKTLPFDVNQVAVRLYHHQGEDIEASEAKRFTQILTEAITSALDSPVIDSPIYSFLPHLKAPFLGKEPYQPNPLPLPNTDDSVDSRRQCFVVMGFGMKTDFETGRTLDLDMSYKHMIKPAVEAAGLKCIRADEIVHSGMIDAPMYKQLLSADVVIADISTLNKNTLYELGVCHGLRPYTTIVIAEDGIKAFPFDANNVLVRQYHHLGEDIGTSEARRFSENLTKAIVQIMEKNPRDKDSPVYNLLSSLYPPVLSKTIDADIEGAAKSIRESDGASSDNVIPAAAHSVLMQQVDEAQKSGKFLEAKTLLATVRNMRKMNSPVTPGEPTIERPEDPYIVQRLALVTYKSKYPTEEGALQEARELLTVLNPRTSNDTETLGLWGAVHKRFWELTKDREYLDESVRSYERGFYLRNDYYNGINLAYMLNVRCTNAATPAEAVADFVQAQRIRCEVRDICQEVLKSENLPFNARYWAQATEAEACIGMGDKVAEEQGEQLLEVALKMDVDQWMKDSTQEQLHKLRSMLTDSPLKYIIK